MKKIIDFLKRRFGIPETFCGIGSYLENTKEATKFITDIIKQKQIKTIADVGCGDLNWLQFINLKELGVKYYVGYDFDQEMLEIAKMRAGLISNDKSIFYFKQVDIRQKIRMSRYDLIICRDLFIHLEDDEILNALKLFTNSGSRWLIASNYIIGKNLPLNRKIEYTKRKRKSRKINLYLPPYSLPRTEDIIREVDSNDKFLCLWDLEKIRKFKRF